MFGTRPIINSIYLDYFKIGFYFRFFRHSIFGQSLLLNEGCIRVGNSGKVIRYSVSLRRVRTVKLINFYVQIIIVKQSSLLLVAKTAYSKIDDRFYLKYLPKVC